MADYEYVASTGVIVPDTADTLSDVQSEFLTAFGLDLSLAADTPQGVLMVAEALARDAVARNNADVANQINPNLAGGVFLDAIWALTGGERARATRSTIAGATLAGAADTVIPEGSQAKAGDDLFETTSTVILDATGHATVDFRAVEYGPIAVDVGDLNQIATSVLGWETVTNPFAAIIGRTEESDQASRARRRQTLANQGVALPEAILSAIFATEGVRSAVFRENITGATVVIDGQSLVEHSIYVAVQGGTDLDVATALLNNKSLGANWNGTTTVNVTDPASGQVYPVKFQRPVAVPIYVRVTVRSDAAIADPETMVRSAIIAYANGELSDEPGFVIGQDVSVFELAGAINRVDPPIFITAITTSTDGVVFNGNNIPINIAQIATVLEGAIEVTVI